MDKLMTMRAFVAVAREESFTKGAERLGSTTKLVSKYVKQLETDLRAQLFNRTTRRVSLTDVGRAYLQRCQPILDQLDELEDLVRTRQTNLAGQIRMTAPTGFGSTRLAAALAPFMRSHPDVEIDLRLSDTVVQLVEEGIDLAVRIGTLRDSSMVARKLCDMPLLTVASPAYLDRYGTPKSPEALATHTCLIDRNRSEPTLWRFTKGGQEHDVRVAGTFQANAPAALANMAAGGAGIGRCPEYSARDFLADGRLSVILPDFETDMLGVYAVYPPNRHLTARVRAMIDHLKDAFGETP